MLPRAARVAGKSIRTRPFTSPSLKSRHANKSRLYSTQQKSPTGEFYSAFTRPVAKCLLLALFTYQVVYWGWVKLEQDEFKENREAEIAQLEAQVQTLQEAAKKKEDKKPEVAHEPQQHRRWWWPF